MLTTDPNDPRLGRGIDEEETGQQDVYLVLSEEEREKGFVRPINRSYIHVGKDLDLDSMIPVDEYFELDPEEYSDERRKKYKEDFGYVGFIPNEDKDSAITGRWVKENDLNGGCGAVTIISPAIAETYARDPNFYGSTYCCKCRKHLAVEEFIWNGTDIRVGD